VSKGLFEGNAMKLKGLPWCKTEERTIGLASASSKMLCKKHNEALSCLDDEAIRMFDFLRELNRLRAVQTGMPTQAWRAREWRVNGRLLERWFVKTLINLVHVQGQDMSWPGGVRPRIPTREVVEACFGLAPIVRPRGLHGAAAVGQTVDSHDFVSFSPITQLDILAGAAFEFRGLRFLLAWTDRDLHPVIDGLAASRPEFAGWRGSHLLQPFRGLNSRVGAHRSSAIKIVWPPFRPAVAP
jgi:hypothetical protein